MPGRRDLTLDAREELAQAELLIVNLQGVRGRKTLDTLRHLVVARGENDATLIVASNPTELLALGMAGIEQMDHAVIGASPNIFEARVFPVGKDRLLAERSYEFAVHDSGVLTDETIKTLELAKSAWWAVRQSVGGELDDLPEVTRFLSALEHLRIVAPYEAATLAAMEQLLHSASDEVLANERKAAVVEAVLSAGGSSEILVLARDMHSARLLRQALAEALDEPVQMLEELGVRFKAHYSPPPVKPPSAVVLAGYFGRASLDATLASGADRIRCVMDPAEVRAAAYGLRQSSNYLRTLGAVAAARGLEPLLEELGRHSPAEAADMKVELDLRTHGVSGAWDVSSQGTVSPGEALVYLMDGVTLSVKVNARLDVLPEKSSQFCSTRVTEVQPGDRIVILNDEERRTFSQELMTILDKGPLLRESQQRQLWTTIVRAIVAQRRPNLRDIWRRMEVEGVQVSYAAVRAWTRPSVESNGSVQSTYARFVTFAKLLGVELPQSQMAEIFQGIRRLRILHRKAGRNLARVMRAAYLNRLEAVTLARVEREWGFEVRRLLEAAHVGIVDEVVLPEDYQDDSD